MDTERDIRLRKFRLKDLEAVKRLVDKTIEVSYSGIYPEGTVEHEKSYHAAECILSDSRDGYTVVLEFAGRIIGTGTLLRTNIRRVFIDPVYQRKGFGKLIMRELEERALAKGISTIDLSATLVSKRFYDSLDYVTRKEDYIPLENKQKLIYYAMVKELDTIAH